ncbi:MAG: butyrate kinase [Thermodesulfobacteriota bacterium]
MKDHGSDMNGFRILAINPGSTSTKVALFEGDGALAHKTLSHSDQVLSKSKRVLEQLDMRIGAIQEFLEENRIVLVHAVAGRGGLLRPLPGGTYRVNETMLRELAEARYGEHASNLGPLLASHFGGKFGTPAFIVDPISVDEFEPCSRISGVPGIERQCRVHALNIKAVARRRALEMGRALEDTRFVVAHLGGGISVCALAGGRIVDSTDALLGEGPFSMERSGTLPLAGLIDLCFDKGLSKEDVRSLLSRGSGFTGYTGCGRFMAALERIEGRDTLPSLVFEAMVRQTIKWIGAMMALCKGKPDAVILTGGMANSKYLIDAISACIGPFAEVISYPGEFEMEALAEGVLRVLQKREPALEYQGHSEEHLLFSD